MSNTVFGRRHSKLFTSFHVSWFTLYKVNLPNLELLSHTKKKRKISQVVFELWSDKQKNTDYYCNHVHIHVHSTLHLYVYPCSYSCSLHFTSIRVSKFIFMFTPHLYLTRVSMFIFRIWYIHVCIYAYIHTYIHVNVHSTIYPYLYPC